MATVIRGATDSYVERIRHALEEYERAHSGAEAMLYRQSNGSVRVRILDERFANMSPSNRHNDVFKFLASHLDDDTIEEISILLLLCRSEQASSFLNHEFDDPIPSGL